MLYRKVRDKSNVSYGKEGEGVPEIID